MTARRQKTLAALWLAALWLAAALAGCAPAQHAAPVYEIVPADPAKPADPVERRVVMPNEIVVREGDTLIALAHLYDLDYKEVARWNNLRDANLIQPGQRLRLTPPPNDPVVIPVRQKPAPVLRPVDSGAVAATPQQPSPAADAAQIAPSAPPPPKQPAATAPSTPPAKPVAPPAQPATPAAPAQPVVPPAPAPAAPAKPPAPADIPFKTEPRAAKYPYSPDTLKVLQTAWQNRAQAPAATPPAAAKPTPAASAGKTRQRFGIAWSRPTANRQLTKYSSQTKGIDFAGQRGNAVLAAADGVVIYVGTGVKSYGRLVIVRHDNNYLSAYAHNEKILVKENDKIKRGDKIATMGDSGSDRVMLHFEVRKDGKPMDPAQVLPQ